MFSIPTSGLRVSLSITLDISQGNVVASTLCFNTSIPKSKKDKLFSVVYYHLFFFFSLSNQTVFIVNRLRLTEIVVSVDRALNI
jgi:hypothetical protein